MTDSHVGPMDREEAYRAYKKAEARHMAWSQFNVWDPVYGGVDPRKVALANNEMAAAEREMRRLMPLIGDGL